MSKTKPCAYGQVDFWIYDVSVSILFAEMIGVAEQNAIGYSPAWLATVVPDMRRHAAVGSDFFLRFDGWVDGHDGEFIRLVTAACERLRARGRITQRQAAHWRVLDEETVHWRGTDDLLTAPVVALGRALVEIIGDRYDDPPTGTLWYLGCPDHDGYRTIATNTGG